MIFWWWCFWTEETPWHPPSLLELAVPPTGPTQWCSGRCSAWGATWLCRALELSCSEATFPPFMLPLCAVRGSIFMGQTSHMPVSEWLGMGTRAACRTHGLSVFKPSPPARWLLHQLEYQHLVTSSAALHWLSHHHPCQRGWSKLAQQKNFICLTCLSIILLCICAACAWQLKKKSYLYHRECHIYQTFSDNGFQLGCVCRKTICRHWVCLHAVCCSKFVLGVCCPHGEEAEVQDAGISDVFSERWPVTCLFPSGIPRWHDRMTDRWC